MKHLMFLVVCAGISYNLFAQEDDQATIISRMVPNTVDIRSIGMGKTEVAGKTGSNAVFSNPSLLALQEKGSVKLGTSLNFGFEKNEATDEIIDETDADLKYGYKPNFKFSNISAAVPIHFQLPSAPISIAFGAGYQNAINLSFTKYSEEESSDGNYNWKSRYTGGLNTVTPGFSFGAFDRISAGISLNIGFGKIRTKIIEEFKNGLAKEESEMHTTATGKAFYPTFGFSGKPLENMTIGISVSPSFEWEFDEIEIETESDESDNEFEMDGGEFTMPSKFSFGLEYQITPNFSLAVEYQTRPFESFEVDAETGEDGGGMIGYEQLIDSMDLENGHVFHLGAEIIAGKVPVRLGFFLEPCAITDQNVRLNGTLKYDGKPNYMMGGTFGLGIPVGNSAFIDLATQYGFLKNTVKIPKKYTDTHHLIRVDLGLNIDLPAVIVKKSASPIPQSTNAKQNSQPNYQNQQSTQPNYQPYPQTAPEQITPEQYQSPDSNSSEEQINRYQNPEF